MVPEHVMHERGKKQPEEPPKRPSHPSPAARKVKSDINGQRANFLRELLDFKEQHAAAGKPIAYPIDRQVSSDQLFQGQLETQTTAPDLILNHTTGRIGNSADPMDGDPFWF